MGWIDDELASPHRLTIRLFFFFPPLLDMDAVWRKDYYSPLYYPILHPTNGTVIDWEAHVASFSL